MTFEDSHRSSAPNFFRVFQFPVQALQGSCCREMASTDYRAIGKGKLKQDVRAFKEGQLPL